MRGFRSPFKHEKLFPSEKDAVEPDPAPPRAQTSGEVDRKSNGSDSVKRGRDVENALARDDDGQFSSRQRADSLENISFHSMSRHSRETSVEKKEDVGEGRLASEVEKSRDVEATPRRELEVIQNVFEDVLERAERMKRTSSADDLSTTVNDLRRLSERLRETSASRKSEGRELARQMAQRSWNFSIEKTALETKADTGVINDSYFSHLLDLRYVSCELLDHALGLADGFESGDGMVSPVNLPSGIINHTTLAIMLHQAGEYKQAEEQFLIGESYANSFLNQNGELDGEVMLLIFESQVTRAKNCFHLGNTVGARDFFHDAKFYLNTEKMHEQSLMCAITLTNAKINLVENFTTPKSFPSMDAHMAFTRNIDFLIHELSSSYGDLFVHSPNLWSTSSRRDESLDTTLDKDVTEPITLAKTDGLYIRILHNTAMLLNLAKKFEDALVVLQKIKVIKGYIKSSKQSDNVLARDLFALTDSFFVDSLFVEAFAGIGDVAKAGEALDNMFDNSKGDISTIHTCCMSLARNECGAKIVASNLPTLVKRMSAFSKSKTEELITNIIENLLDRVMDVDESCAAEILADIESFLTNSDLFREVGFTRNGKSCAYAIIWNTASEMYMQNKYALARSLFGMTLPLSSQRKVKDASNASVLVIRLQIMCDLEDGNIERAKESLQSLLSHKNSTKQKALDVPTTLLNIKLQLISADMTALAESVEFLAKSSACEALLYVAGELTDTKHHAAAADAFHKLLDMVFSGNSTDQTMKYSGFIFCSYLRHLKASVDGKFESKALADTAELFREFNKRVKLVDAPQAQYLADFAWNIALDAFNQYESEAAHNLMLCTAYIISKLSDRPFNLGETELEEYTYRQAVALLLAVASLTTCAPNVKTESEETRKEREKMNISRSKAAMAQLRVILKNKTSEKYAALQQISHVLEYEIACAKRDVTLQNKIINALVQELDENQGVLNVLLMVADRGALMRTSDLIKVSHAYEKVATFLRRMSLDNGPIIGRVMRKRIQLSSRINKSSDDVIHSLYDEATELLEVYTSYPPVEAQWLLSTCFNRAVRHERSMRTKQAIEWLNQTQKLMNSLQGILPQAIETYSTIVSDNLAMLTIELDAAE